MDKRQRQQRRGAIPQRQPRLTGRQAQALTAGAEVGLFVVFSRDRKGELWTVFSKLSGRFLLSYRPKGGYWSKCRRHGRVKDGQSVLRLSKHDDEQFAKAALLWAGKTYKTGEPHPAVETERLALDPVERTKVLLHSRTEKLHLAKLRVAKAVETQMRLEAKAREIQERRRAERGRPVSLKEVLRTGRRWGLGNRILERAKLAGERVDRAKKHLATRKAKLEKTRAEWDDMQKRLKLRGGTP
jgi:hypothetical protein